MRVTSKGQVTIPIAIRRKYGIFPDAEVEFVETEAGPVIRLCPQSGLDRGQHLIEHLRSFRSRAIPGTTTEELMRLMRGWGEPDPGFDEPGDGK